MKFPDIESGLAEVLADLAPVVTHLPKEPSQRVPFIYVSPIPSPGSTELFLSEDRFLVEIYGTGRTATRDLAYEVVTHLDGRHFSTSYGLLDRVNVVIRPNETPLQDDTLNSFNFSILVSTRATN